jgi:hypothetical protein
MAGTKVTVEVKGDMTSIHPTELKEKAMVGISLGDINGKKPLMFLEMMTKTINLTLFRIN